MRGVMNELEIRMRIQGIGQYDKKPFQTWTNCINGMHDALRRRESLLAQEQPKITDVMIQTREVEPWRVYEVPLQDDFTAMLTRRINDPDLVASIVVELLDITTRNQEAHRG